MNDRVKSIHGEALPPHFKPLVEYIHQEVEGDDNKKILFAMPQSAGDIFLSTSLFRSMKELYPEYNIYVGTMEQYKALLDDNPYVYKILTWNECMVAQAIMMGSSDWKGFFDIFFTPFITTQSSHMNYVRNGEDIIPFDIRY